MKAFNFVHYSTVGDRAFPVSAARVWNGLPARHIVAVATHLQMPSENFPFLPKFSLRRFAIDI